MLAAARALDSFYGLLARETLGMDHPPPRPGPAQRRRRLAPQRPSARANCCAIGERALADALLRHQARDRRSEPNITS